MAPTGKVAATDWTLRVATLVTRLLHAFAQHWLLIANIALGIQALLPALAPLLMFSGATSAGRLLYTLYSPLCHQLPERSFFLFGPQWAYTLLDLQQLVGPDVPLRYIGNATIGYKMAVCQRDISAYAGMWLAGLVFALVRHHLRPLSLKLFALLASPMAVDGLGQLLGVWDSNPWRRVVSGVIFGVACIWLAFPHVEAGMKDVLEVVEREVQAQG